MEDLFAYKLDYPVHSSAIDAEPQAWGWWLLSEEYAGRLPEKTRAEYAEMLFTVLHVGYALPLALAVNRIAYDCHYGEISNAEVEANLRECGVTDFADMLASDRSQFDAIFREGQEIYRAFNNRYEG